MGNEFKGEPKMEDFKKYLIDRSKSLEECGEKVRQFKTVIPSKRDSRPGSYGNTT